jgi:protein-disulfide isomerase
VRGSRGLPKRPAHGNIVSGNIGYVGVSKQNKHESHAKAQRQSRQQRQQWLAIGLVGAVVLIVFGGLLVWFGSARNNTIGPYDLLYQTTTSTGIPLLGDPQTVLTVTEISDFGCPSCVAYQPTIQQFIDKYVRTGQARFELALVTNYPHSDVAAQVSLCAGQQHKFWEMTDALYDVQAKQGTDGFTLGALRHVAESLGVDGSALLDCVTNGQARSALNAALSFYNSVNGTGTPILFWSANGKTNWQPFIGNDNQPYLQREVPLYVIDRTIADYYRAHHS